MQNFLFWDEKDKAEMFNRIAENYYNKNFGNFSKSQSDLLMFDIFLKKTIEENTKADGTIDYEKCSDYNISKELGITQQRVKSLKVKKQLIYPEQYDWIKALASISDRARYENGKIIIPIPDPNLYLEIDNAINEKGGYAEYSLNSKLLKMRVEYFIQLAIDFSDESSKNKIIKELKKQFKNTNKDNNVFDEKNIAKSLQCVSNITSFVSSFMSIAGATGLFAILDKLF